MDSVLAGVGRIWFYSFPLLKFLFLIIHHHLSSNERASFFAKEAILATTWASQEICLGHVGRHGMVWLGRSGPFL